MEFIIDPAGIPAQITKKITVPGDKSISHRALMIGSLARGTSYFSNCLVSEDVMATCRMLEHLGVKIESSGDQFQVIGRGLASFTEPSTVLDLGNSGTTTRLGMGLIVPSRIFAVLTGDASLRRRPMDRVIIPLSLLGARFQARQENTLPPVAILPSGPLKPAEYQGIVPSAQVKSAFLLAALQIPGTSIYHEPVPTRDHTERMLQAAGADLTVLGSTISVTGGKPLNPLIMEIPGDPSAAAFWVVAGLLVPEAEFHILNVGVNPRRTGFIRVLERMGGNVHLTNLRTQGGEEVCDLIVKSSELRGCVVSAAEIPDLIDEVPILAVAAAFAKGTTVFEGVGELRYKESDRVESIVTQFGGLGVQASAREDVLEITGGDRVSPGVIDSLHDHRIAMAGAILALRAAGPVKITGGESIYTSYPDFIEQFKRLFGPESVQELP